MSAAEFHTSAFRGDGSGATCPSCSGVGTQTHMAIDHNSDEGIANFARAARMPGTVLTHSGHYGPACDTCFGNGKVFEHTAETLSKQRLAATEEYRKTKSPEANAKRQRTRQSESKVRAALKELE